MPAVSEAVQSPDPVVASPSGGPRLRLPSRRTLVATGFLLIVVASVVAFLQEPDGDPLNPPAFPSLAWWMTPVEKNPLLRLPATGPINQVVVHPETGDLFAVGDGGLIIHSSDGGRTWNQRPVKWLASSPDTPPPAPAGGSAPSRRSRVEPSDDVRLASFTQAPQQQGPPVQQAIPKDDKQSVDPKTAYEAPKDSDASKRSNAAAPSNAAARPADPTPQAAAQTIPEGPRPFAALMGMTFASGGFGIAVGAGGAVLTSGDRGLTWEQRGNPTALMLTDVAVTSDGRVVCASTSTRPGRGTMVLRSGDGGQTWESKAVDSRGTLLIDVTPAGRFFVFALGETFYTSDDGCRTWQLSESGPLDGLSSIHALAGTRTAWGVGRSSVSVSKDDGATWTVLHEFDDTLTAVVFADELRGWVGDVTGRVHRTVDGGRTWTSVDVFGGGAVTSLVATRAGVFASAQGQGFAQSDDDGRTWRTESAPQLTAVFMLADGKRGWAVGTLGTLLATTDGGRSWTTRRSGTSATLYDVHFLDDRRRGWAVGYDGVMLRTTDAGSTWELQQFDFSRQGRARMSYSPSGSDELLLVQFEDERRGVLIGPDVIHVTADGGQTWVHRQGSLGSYAVGRFRNGWLLQDGRDLRRLSDGSLEFQLLRGSVAANMFAWQAGGAVWAVGDNGLLASSADDGVTWTPKPMTTKENFNTISFSADGSRGWIVGSLEQVWATSDRGVTWQRQPVNPRPWHRIVPLSAGGALALSAGATMYRTTDGVTWAPLLYRAYPAPWFYLASLIGFAVIGLVAVRGPETQAAQKPSVADVFVSDRPLERGDPDALALARVASGLARFLANDRTEPPLTIAITGEWGSGKTSLMNLSRAQLRDYGFRTVWFNAWHHQTEEHLLGALVESLRRHALAPWWSPRGFTVRVRLLMFRGIRHWVPAGGALVAFFAAAGYFFENPLQRLTDARQWVGGLVGLGGGPTSSGAVDLLSILATAGGLVPLLKGMQAFGSSGRQISSTLNAYDPLKELKLPTGFRHRFAEMFHDITRALEPQQLVIFIDDLDRCHPKNVVATLEMVNFLVSSGRCIVIIGMARERVERCVGIGFEDVAMLGGDEDDETAAKRAASQRLKDFAQQYLEKLINIEIPVPRVTPEQSHNLLDTAFFRRDRFTEQWGRSAKAVGQWLAAAATVVALAVAGYQSGLWVHSMNAVDARRDSVATSATPSQAPVTPATTNNNQPAPAPRPDAAGSNVESVLVPGVFGRPSWFPLALAVIFALVVAVPRLRQVGVHVEHDSPGFTAALDRWFPLVYRKTPTPRAMKRFLNRVRFYAMAQRDLPATIAEAPSLVVIPDEALVSLAAMRHAGIAELDEALMIAADAPGAEGSWQQRRIQMARDFEDAIPYHGAFHDLSRGVNP